jgi:hypothetical protein
MALSKCFDRTRSGAVERAGEVEAATELLRLSTLDAARPVFFEVTFARLRETFADVAFTAFVFKRKDLVAADARPAGFFAALGLGFALVAMRSATYTSYVS